MSGHFIDAAEGRFHFPIFVEAHAKINLTLDVLGRRADGYHELASVMQTVALHDTLLLRPAAPGVCACVCDVPELRGEENLALRAARMLRDEVDGGHHGVEIELRKQIPSQAGLGGGSSDAAAVLLSLNRLWSLDLDHDRLIGLAATLGSDVPFFVRGGTGRIGGRGEVVGALPGAQPLWLVLARPAAGSSTPAVFKGLTPADYSDGARTARVVATILAGEPLPLDALGNGLEAVAMRLEPAIAATREALVRAGAPVVHMSGSGSALYAPFRRLEEAEAVYRRAEAEVAWVQLTHTIGTGEERGSDSGGETNWDGVRAP
jgi:4-diphosphocytidyl-2-C-methyl-D-erythritol kinase